MKSMKTIIRLLGATVLTTASLSTVVACGGQQKTDQEYSDAIVNQLEVGVDGSSLDTLKTQADALTLLQAAATKIKVGATVVFATPSDGHTRLVIGNNTLRVIVTVGSKSETFDAVLTGILAH